MTDKVGGGKKIGSVKQTETAKQIQRAAEIGGVSGIKATAKTKGVVGINEVGGGRITRTLSLAEREQLLKLVDEEAPKLFASSGLSEERQRVLRDAVKMALDSTLTPADKESAKR